MPNLSLSELDDRARDIFRRVVESYLEHGAPVGSKTLSNDPAINLSPASIRSVLAELERAGLLIAPHTSAGRVPTGGGLRLFVDGLMQMTEPTDDERAAIEARMERPGPIEVALEKTSVMLSEISGGAGMVTVPRREARLTQLNLVPIAARRVLAVLVGADGHVENRVLDLDAAFDSSALQQAENYINTRMAGRTLAEAEQILLEELSSRRTALDEASRELVRRGIAVWSQDVAERPVLIVRGQANLLDDEALSDLERVRMLLDDLEQRSAVADVLESAKQAEATRIFIGSENRLFALSGSAVIASPYRNQEGRVVGVVGVIGPTRLNYARLVPMVDLTARSLGKLIG